MKTHKVRTDTMTLGPFLTMILNATARSPNQDPSNVCSRTRISSLATLRREEMTTEAQTFRLRRQTLGPFVSLILRLVEQRAAELRFAAEQNHRQALCVRVHVG
jgi:hypothetical protein